MLNTTVGEYHQVRREVLRRQRKLFIHIVTLHLNREHWFMFKHSAGIHSVEDFPCETLNLF